MNEPRFQNIVAGGCPVPLYDTVLWDLGDVVVTPTLGSIIPHWLLVIPRRHAFNIAEWKQKHGGTMQACISEVAKRARRPVENIIWFEHGATENYGVTGCGVDHAHVHLLLETSFRYEDFEAAAQSAAPWLDWRRGTGNPYDLLSPNVSYLVAAKGDSFIASHEVESAGSQFFRRVIATLEGKPHSWNYRTHPHLNNVELTVASVRSQL